MNKNVLVDLARNGVKNLDAKEVAGLIMWAMGLSKQDFRDQEIREWQKGVDETPELSDEEKEDAIERSFGELKQEDRERQYWLPCAVCKDRPKFFNGKVNQWWFKDEEGDGKWKLCAECGGKGGWHDDPSKPEAYWTLSGDMNSTKDWMQEMYGQQIARNFRELAPAKVYYATSMWPRAVTTDETKVFAEIVKTDAIVDEKARAARLELLWKRFWKRVYAMERKSMHVRNGVRVSEKGNAGRVWISPRWVARIKKMFAARGVMSQAKRQQARAAVLSQLDKQF